MVLLQSIIPAALDPAVGGVKSADTVAISESIHPSVFVTVNVYVPAASTVGVAVPAPAVILPPPEALHE